MRTILLVDHPAEVRWAVDERADVVVAMNARAADALARSGVPHEDISAYVKGPELVALDQVVVDHTMALVDRIEHTLAGGEPDAREVGASQLVSDQSYFLAHAASVIALRARMIACVLARAAGPVHLVMGDQAPPVFAANGYARSPWLTTVRQMVETASGRLEIRRTPDPAPVSGSGQPAWRRAARPLAAWWRSRQPRMAGRLAHEHGARILIVDGISHDWLAFAPELNAAGVELLSLTTWPLEQLSAFPIHAGPLRDQAARVVAALPPLEIVDGAVGAAAIDAWRAADSQATFDVGGVDILADLMPYLRSIAQRAASVHASIDRIAAAAIDCARPEIVGFWAMASFSSRRFARLARSRGVPVICYQHGGAYGTHEIASHALLEPNLADHILTYGDGVTFAPSERIPVPARTWPIGSARIERLLRAQSPAARTPRSGKLRVLWAAETSTSNTDSSAFVVEDTVRFEMERTGLERLALSGSIDVCYRPYPGTEHKVATVDWLERTNPPGVRVDGRSPMADLITAADVVITMTSSGTVWNEVLAFERPLLLFCEPNHPILRPEFAAALDRACVWCKSREAFESALSQLAASPAPTAAAWRRPTDAFVQKFVLPGDQRGCAGRALDAFDRIISDVAQTRDALVAIRGPIGG